MIRQLEYTPQGRAKGLPLRFNMWNYYSVTASGDLEAYPDHVECQGERPGMVTKCLKMRLYF
ncbi:MAG: hypothetical protein GY696_01900 [Gammaproteobacteria bacterium]|nr:hypothetical protein [Gammaproteobacteria bacterium]